MFRYGEDRLTVSKAMSIMRGELKAVLQEERRNLIQERHLEILDIAQGSIPVYGINTGFGPLCSTKIDGDETVLLQENLLQSHAVGVGEYVDREIAKLMLILKVHSLSQGHSGISIEIIDRILWHIDQDIIPCVPSQGSLGASGDLAPLAHLFLPLIGEGEVSGDHGPIAARDLLDAHDMGPVALHAKAGLALINGTQFMLAHSVYALDKIYNLLCHADLVAGLMAEGMLCSRSPYDYRLHEVRPHRGVQYVAQKMWSLLEGSQIMESHRTCDRVQDPYSVRCVPQVHGSSRQAWLHFKETLEIELNSVTDNPVWVQGGDVISGGHFHGQPLALPIDYCALATAEIGSISERRLYFCIDGQRSEIPKLLIRESGVNSGFMIVQYTAAALVSENKSLCFPASADSIPSSLGQEDHVSMGAHGVRKLLKICDHVEKILACEFFAAAQAMEFHRPLRSSPLLEAVHSEIRSVVDQVERDRIFSADIQAIADLIRKGDLRKHHLAATVSQIEEDIIHEFENY